MSVLVAQRTRARTSIETLVPGQLVFCARPSLLQSAAEFVGDEFRHVGVVIEGDDGLVVCHFGRNNLYSVMPVADLAGYGRVGVASVFKSDAEVADLQRWVAQFKGTAAFYPSSSVPIGLLLSFTRAVSSGMARRAMSRLSSWYCQMMSAHHRDHVAFICSTFIFAAVNAARAEPLRLDMLGDKSKEQCDSSPGSTTEVLLARWLSAPSDIWRAIPAADRRELLTAA